MTAKSAAKADQARDAESGGGAPEGGSGAAGALTLEAQREFFLRLRLQRAQIPRRFLNKSLKNFRATDVDEAPAGKWGRGVRQGVQPEGRRACRGLIMEGPVGCGKSHLAVAILREVIEKGYSGLYYNSPDLLAEIRATYSNDEGPSEDTILEEVAGVDLLVLDDLGAEKVSGFVLDRFYLIINKRYENCKPIIVTTNLDQETLINRLGERIVSRLLEMCQEFKHFPEVDYRREKLKGKG
jgi:DNA replication protein DnaC